MYNQCLNPLCMATLVLFTFISLIHLIKCFKQKQKWADFTKFMLMPSLLLFFLAFSFVNIQRFSILNLLIIIALIFSFFGDVALLFDREKRNFALGVLFFGITQICYIIFALIGASTSISLIPAIVLALLFVAFIIYSLMRTKKQLKGLRSFVITYALLLSAMGWLFIVFAIASPSLALILAAVGSVMFIISDTLVSAQYFLGSKPRIRFLIMLTYILAQVLIVFGAIGIIGV